MGSLMVTKSTLPVKSSLGDQAPSASKTVHSDLHYHVSGLQLALCRKMRLSDNGKSRELDVINSKSQTD